MQATASKYFIGVPPAIEREADFRPHQRGLEIDNSGDAQEAAVAAGPGEGRNSLLGKVAAGTIARA
jgi:hypothetical protein